MTAEQLIAALGGQRWCLRPDQAIAKLVLPADGGAGLSRCPTVSIDAALTLVPEKVALVLIGRSAPLSGITAGADLYRAGARHKPPDVCDVYAATPAIALCIAALKAEETQHDRV